uniref:Plectin/eS10 N-terminal domain-containing protein n=1 Tax=Knipowitschia caucasica TaxID=637954 RepID=A0AAV2M706_KNICA
MGNIDHSISDQIHQLFMKEKEEPQRMVVQEARDISHDGALSELVGHVDKTSGSSTGRSFRLRLLITAKMLMPKKNRIAIYELLFKEGVMVAKKDVHLAKHPELADKNVPNLHVMKAMQSLKSCGYVKEQFAWRHFYWYLTNEGIQYLRDFLHLPPEIVPATLRRQTRPETARPRPKGMEGERPARLNRGEADRDAYRRSAAPPGADKKAEAGAGAATEFQFRGGFGRGRGQPPQ